MHITNCCANSHDEQKFMGEICADLTLDPSPSDTHTKGFFSPFYDTTLYDSSQIQNNTVIPLANYFPSISASVKTLAQQSFYFLQGGEANHGFEYLGLDFILSYRPSSPSSSFENNTMSFNQQLHTPLAYLLEVNAPPSQDTATGLPHAEALHDQVLKDWIDHWVIPHVMPPMSCLKTNTGGWIHIHTYLDPGQKANNIINDNTLISPSKAAWLNKIRWALYQNKMIRKEKDQQSKLMAQHTPLYQSDGYKGTDMNSKQSIMFQFRRKSFPFFQQHVPSNFGLTATTARSQPLVYFENAGSFIVYTSFNVITSWLHM